MSPALSRQNVDAPLSFISLAQWPQTSGHGFTISTVQYFFVPLAALSE